MFNRKNANAKQAQSSTIHGSGIVKGNPKRCLYCRMLIRKGEAWTKHTSPDGAYSMIVHDRCNGRG